MKASTIPLLGVAAAATAYASPNHGPAAAHTRIQVPLSLPTRPLVKDVYGYSVEPVWLDSYLETDLFSNLMGVIAQVAGKPPPIRVGGNTADQTYLHPDQAEPSFSEPNATAAVNFNISGAWYGTWADYFPDGTDLIYTLNFRDNRTAWANALAQAEAVHRALGPKLRMFELGNEIDHFINKGWRDETWGVHSYIDQWRNLTQQIVASDWYQDAAAASEEGAPKFQAAVFADPPWVPDQHDEIDDMDIVNLTRAELADDPLIETYCVHMYPQSTCDTERWYRMRLDLLSDHSVLWRNVSQYVPQVAAADEAGAHLVMGETNSASCSGHSGISDTFGAALWAVDYVLLSASIGMRQVYFHLGAQSEYSAFTPLPYELKGESLEPGIRAPWYAHYFLAHVVSGDDSDGELSVAQLPGANASDLSGFGIWGSDSSLRKLVLLDMGVWNASSGLSNPSTLSASDSASRSNGTRPSRRFEIQVPWANGTAVEALRLSAPGTNAKSAVDVSGVTFDAKDGGSVIGEPEWEAFKVVSGTVSFEVPRAGGILLQVGSAVGGGGDGGGDGETPPVAGAGRSVVLAKWVVLAAVLAPVLML